MIIAQAFLNIGEFTMIRDSVKQKELFIIRLGHG